MKDYLTTSNYLLDRAADKLQDYCSAAHGDVNDSLAGEIRAWLEYQKTPAPIRKV